MKLWEKTLLALSMIALAFSALIYFYQPEDNCVLCDSFRYHAPCLIDIETGDMIELDIYFPHETKAAELADLQPRIDTFSFVHIGNIVGSKLTGDKVIEFDVPLEDRFTTPTLCKKCQALLPAGYTRRYVLADLYDPGFKKLYPIYVGNMISLRCYEVSMIENNEEKAISVTIQGTLETNN